MTTNRKKPAIEKAMNYLRNGIDSGRWAMGTRIPICKELAKDAFVSIASMFKALTLLQHEKKLTSRQRLGTFVGPKVPDMQPDLPCTEKILKWQRIEQQMTKDIFEGKFNSAPVFPSMKELMSLYATGYSVLKKAIDSLVGKDLLKPEKRNYHINDIQRGALISTIVFILSEETVRDDMRSLEKESIEEFVRSLEKDCTRRNIRLVKHPATLPFSKSFKLPSTAGFIIWHNMHINSRIMEILSSLQTYNKPIACINRIWDVGLETSKQLIELSGKKKQFFVSDITREKIAGNKMGRFMLSKGHKKICIIRHLKKQGELPNNEGLIEAFRSSGLQDGVVELFWEDFKEKELDALRSEGDVLYDQSLPQENRLFDITMDTFGKSIPASLAAKVNNHIQEIKFIRNYHYVYGPLFRKALTIPGVSAWICNDDSVACYGMLEFLKTEKIKVPVQIGVAGFDDRIESSFHSLTSYHFDYAGAARKMVGLVLYPESARKVLCIKGTNVFEVDGMVIDRGSV